MHLLNPWEHYLNQLPCNYHSPSVPPGPQLICWHLAAFCTSQAFLAGWPAAWQERWVFQKRKKKVNNLRDVLISWDCLTCHIALPASWFAKKARSITYHVSLKVKYMTSELELNSWQMIHFSILQTNHRQIKSYSKPNISEEKHTFNRNSLWRNRKFTFLFHVTPIFISKN